MVRYSKPYLKTVIVRLDFASPIDNLSKNFPKNLAEAVKSSFPISEPHEFINKEFNISPKSAIKERVSKQGTEWVFYSDDRQNTLNISSEKLVISYNKYPSYDILKNDFLSFADIIFKTFDQVQGRRLGLRYINEINLEESNIIDWTQYINNVLLTKTPFPGGSNNISRINNSIEFNFDSLFFRFIYGTLNPDYPAVIRKKNFTLDYDAYYQGPQVFADISDNLDNFHKKIKEFFEISILDNLRDKMEIINE